MILELFSSSIERNIKSKRERLFRMAYSWCNDLSIADDLVNETLLRALKTKAKLRDKSCLKSWLYKILSNCWYDYLRQKRPLENIEDIVLVEEYSPEQQLQQHQLIQQVRQSVALLAVSQRQVLTLIDLDGMSYQEVSAILDIPIGTVMSRLNRARKILKKQLSICNEENNENTKQSQYDVVKLRRVK
jgi:RNA polymerase sigma-70 factor, ECF subfamily